MKIRTTFTIWIALVSCSAALVFSTFVYFEMLEEQEKLQRREILDVKEAIVAHLAPAPDLSFSPESSDYPLERYYVEVVTGEGESVYESRIASHLEIPRQPGDGFFAVDRPLPVDHIWQDPADNDDYGEIDDSSVRFRAYQDTLRIGDGTVTVTVAKPLARVMVELRELLGELVVFILLTTVLIFICSYVLAGRLLAPINKINEKIATIREHSLDERIPLGKSRDELYTLSTALNTMFDRLQFSFERQREFLSSAAHELKIPLTIIMLGQEEMLAKELPDELKDELQRQLTSLHRLNRLVKDLLAISHLEHKDTIERRQIQLPELISQVLEDFEDLLKARGIHYSLKGDEVSLRGDRDRLMRVFINLIDNAIKYNLPAEGRLDIEVRKHNDTARITFSNTGKVIPAADLPHVFTQFYRVEKSRAQQYGGTGLGLTIVKRIIELHHGSIDIASADGRTTLTLTLPLGACR